MAAEAEALLAGSGWLPEPLRAPNNGSADAMSTGATGVQTMAEGGETAMGDRTTSDENDATDDLPHTVAAE